MYFDHEDDERDPFAAFGDLDADTQMDSEPDLTAEDPVVSEDEPTVVEPETQTKVKTGFSWAAFMGGLTAILWIAGAVGGPISYFGVDALMTMDPAMQAGLIALAVGPALLFWVTASAAGDAMKARRIAAHLTQRMSTEQRFPTEETEQQAKQLTETVKGEIESLNDAVSSALNRLAELESAAQRNAHLFGEAVAASRENVETMTHALKSERDAVVALNDDLKDQTETIAHSIGRQVRLMREASKMVKTEIVAAEDALESHLASFTASATVMGERTAHFHVVADKASAATSSLNGAMTEMLEGLAQATRLTETAKKATAEAVMAANETAGAVRETTRTAVFEAKRAAQLIRAESVAMQEAANDTLAKLQSAASAARAASVESEAAADRYTATIEKRLNALASTAGAKKVSVQRQPEPAVAEEVTSLHAAARVAVARGAGGSSYAEVETQPKRQFKGFGSWGNFMPPQQREEELAPAAANEGGSLELASFGNPDDELRAGAINLVINSGVDIDDVLAPVDLDRIARSSRDGATARRRAVVDAAPGAVGRIARHMKRNTSAQELATQFRSRPDLAKSEKKGEGSDLVRAYLLIDAALAS